MSARKTITQIAKKKGIEINVLSKLTGYSYPHHFLRALDNSLNIAAYRVVALSKALDMDRGQVLTILTKK